MTIYVWCEYSYYDGLFTFARGVVVGAGDVKWLGEELLEVEPTSASGEGT